MVSRCTEGVYLRWWFNGWHYFNFTNGYEIEMQTESQDVQVTNYFSVISKIERDTRITSEYSYRISLEGIQPDDIAGFTGLLLAEQVEQYESGVWRVVQITRGAHLIRDEQSNGYQLNFEIRRRELPESSSVYQKSLRLYVGDTLCDMDDDEIIPINKQVNNIAELQDRNSDFTAQFKIRKTRAMRELFELSGEVGANPDFPYRKQTCRLISDNIEIITGGILVLDRVTDEYYHVSVLSGNINFFKLIETLKLNDLSLPDMVNTWDITTAVSTHDVTSPDGADIVYPMCEPSDDGGAAVSDDGDRIVYKLKHIWPFCKVKTIWEEIFANQGFTVTGGEVLQSDFFNKLYLPIVNRDIADASKYYYSVWWGGTYNVAVNEILAFTGATLIKGTETFRTGYYIAPYTATYKITVSVIAGAFLDPPPTLYLVEGALGTLVATFENITTGFYAVQTYSVEYSATAGDILWIVTTPIYYYYYSIAVTEIKQALIDYGSVVDARLHLPNISQKNFVKLICQLLGLVPEVTARDRKIRFWNYQEIYDNVPVARDWSAYLSERDDEVEFKFGDYGQESVLKFKDSDDVQPDNGKGILPVDDETLPEQQTVVETEVSTCDEVRVLTNVFAVDISRINFNTWDGGSADYKSEKSIDPRIVYIDRIRSVASPPYEKTLGLQYTDPILGEQVEDIDSPLKASSLEVSFSSLIVHYANLSRMLTKTNIRRMKFNLPVYEVAGLKHNVPVYLSQYRAYFYVNRISNFVPGRLTTVELIKLY